MANTQPASPTMKPPVLVRPGAIALAFSGVSFFLYPVVRPWHDESTISGAVTSMVRTLGWLHICSPYSL